MLVLVILFLPSSSAGQPKLRCQDKQVTRYGISMVTMRRSDVWREHHREVATGISGTSFSLLFLLSLFHSSSSFILRNESKSREPKIHSVAYNYRDNGELNVRFFGSVRHFFATTPKCVCAMCV